jgi:hypothetical protein
MQPTTVGLFVGIFLGAALVFGGFAEMLAVAACGALGFIVMKVVEGEIDLNDYIGSGSRNGVRRRH